MSLLRLDLDVTDAAATVNAHLRQRAERGYMLDMLAKYLDKLATGAANVNSGRLSTGAVKAAATVTFTGLPTADETCSIANVTFTAKASGATGNQFNIGADATATGANLASAINASSNLSGIVTASAASGVVTITAVAPGLVGNGLQISESLTNATAAAFANGADATVTTIPA